MYQILEFPSFLLSVSTWTPKIPYQWGSCNKPLGAGVVVALGKGNIVGVGAGRGAPAALQTHQKAQTQTENQRDDQVALTVRNLQKKFNKSENYKH